MAENTDEEPIDSLQNTQSENPSEEIIPTKDTDTINPNQESESMEVHKHPHHVTHKKKWGEYLLEFFMLFLAVFLGFIAENMREHFVEKEREKKYMESLVADLSVDTATINYGLPRKEKKILAIDSIFSFFINNKNATTISGRLFRTLRRTTWDQRFERNMITISQLKNAGNMRLVQKKNVADSIGNYDMLWNNIELYRDGYAGIVDLSHHYAGKLVDPDDLLPLYLTNKSEAIVNNIPDSLTIRIDKTELKEQLNFMMGQKVSIYQQLRLYNNLRESAERLIFLIKKEYNLK